MSLALGKTACRVLEQLAGLLRPGESCHLVGGALRDALRGVPSKDLDFATPCDPTELARRFALHSGGTWFSLDAERRQSRVVLKAAAEEGEATCDFAPYRGPDLAADLSRRDFTINALALPVCGPLTAEALFDPAGGRADLDAGILRACFPATFRDDPLRTLRAVRFASSLNLQIEAGTARWLIEAVPALSQVAAERVRTEISAVFSLSESVPGVRILLESSLAEAVFGKAEPGFDRQACCADLERIDRKIFRLLCSGGCLAGNCREPLEDGVQGMTALRLATFLRRWNPAFPERTLQSQLRFAKRTASVLRSLLELKPEEGMRLQTPPPTIRGQALWVASLGPVPGLNLIWLTVVSADDNAVCSDQAEKICRNYREISRDGRIPDLVHGDWVRNCLNLEGPAVGRALATVRKAEIEGRVQSVQEARKVLISQQQKGVDKG